MDAGLPLHTLAALLKRSAELYAARPALSEARAETESNAKTITYRELYDAVSTLSAKLTAEGIGFGDSVAVLAENTPNWGMAYLAITCMGAVAVPILTEFHSDAIAHIIRHSEAKAVFVSQRMSCKIADAPLDASLLRIDIETMTFTRFGR
ncbi:MAG: AMP-binding protein [Desulfovibrio sp.]|jgi:long-chain acyl-CoA synthetase|nr:AMP-binding protein [Desulfovibrio sp.]